MLVTLAALSFVIGGGGFWLATKGGTKTVWGVGMIVVGALGFIAVCSTIDLP